jgi:hypothetical protein
MKQLISRMKRHARLVLWVFALMILLCLGVRVLWLASRTETGCCTLRQQWRDATAGWFQGNRPTDLYARAFRTGRILAA